MKRSTERTRRWSSALLFMVAACSRPTAPDPVPEPIPEVDGAQWVDPFIGTADEGYTFPGATAPWGMISISPHNLVANALDYVEGRPIAPAGYRFGEPELFGLGLTQLSGVGCPELGVPRISVSTGELAIPSTEIGTATTDERASPGYYAVALPDEGVELEATVTQRAGILRAAVEPGVDVHLHLDAGPGLAWIAGDGHVSLRSPTEIEGWSRTGGFCAKGNQQRVHFAVRLSAPAIDMGTWADGMIGDASEADGQGVGAWLTMSAAEAPLELRVAISYVSMDNAWENLDAELGEPGFELGFDELATQTREVWSELLSRIQVEGGSDEQRTVLYTALYHTLLHPNVFDDVDGSVPSMNGEIVTAASPRYTVYSMWDSYRTVHPLLSLIYPERQAEMIRSLADMTLEYGAPPQWELAASEVNMMVGDPAASVFADAVLAGFDDFDVEAVYQLLRASALDVTSTRRPGNAEYRQLGYVPIELGNDVWGPVSTTLEYAYADWALSRLAMHLGHDEDAAMFETASQSWRQLFDAQTGLLRPKHADGTWLEPFDPDALTGSNPLYQNSGGPGYVEGTAWHYAFAVPHDPLGLAQVHGGEAVWVERLQALFDEGRFAMWNEPDIAYPWLFTHVAAEQRRSIEAVAEAMSHFDASPAGLPGNDDGGTMSAWYVFAAMGLYPDCPGSERFSLARPAFDRVGISLDASVFEGEYLELAVGSTDAWTLDGEPLEGAAITRTQLRAGGRIETP
jgi:predicted alpha-1,2-mannosidase